MSYSNQKVIYRLLFLVINLCVVEFAKPQTAPTTTEAAGQDGVILNANQQAPYILVATYSSISRLVNPWPYASPSKPTSLEELFNDGRGGIQGVTYHYRMGRMFWGNVNSAKIFSANLDGTDVMEVVSKAGEPSDLSMDWINDKLYWTERYRRRIREYDLVTGLERVVFTTSTGTQPTSLIVYPYPGNGWIYWLDLGTASIERVSVNGDGHEVVVSELGRNCIQPLTLDYFSQTVYWTDNCDFSIRSVNISGSQLVFNAPIWRPMSSSLGLALFEDVLYWIVRGNVHGLNQTVGGINTELVYSGSSRNTFGSITMVHASKQPDGETFVEMVLTAMNESTCSLECVNGRCIPPGLCACDRGWLGEDCTTDRNECDVLNGGCQITCVNTIGSYYCSCGDLIGYTLDGNGRNCTGNTSAVTLPRSTSIQMTSVRTAVDSKVLLAMSTRHPLSTTIRSHSPSAHPHTTSSELAPATSVASGQVPVTTTVATPAHSVAATSIPVPNLSISTSIPVSSSSMSTSVPVPSSIMSTSIPVPSSSMSTSVPVLSSIMSTSVPVPSSSMSTSVPAPRASTPVPLNSQNSVDSTTVIMTSLSTSSILVPSPSRPSLESTPAMISLSMSSSPASYHSEDVTSTTHLSFTSSSKILLPASSSYSSSRSSVQSLLIPTQTQSPGTPNPPTDDVEVSQVDVPLVAVISGSVAGGTALIVVVVLILVVAFSCYIRSHQDSYSFAQKKYVVKEPASLRGSKRRPDSLDSKTSFGRGSAHNNVPCSEV